MLFMTTGLGTVQVIGWTGCEVLLDIKAHTSNCFCLDFDPTGRYLILLN